MEEIGVGRAWRARVAAGDVAALLPSGGASGGTSPDLLIPPLTGRAGCGLPALRHWTLSTRPEAFGLWDGKPSDQVKGKGKDDWQTGKRW